MPTKTTAKKKIKSESILYGIEIEFTRPANTEHVSGSINDALQKDIEESPVADYIDASGRDGGGVECRINPFSFEYFRGNKNFFDFIKLADKHKYITDDSTHAGVHIHVDRKIFTEKSFVKFITFLTQNKAFLLSVSNRKRRTQYVTVTTTTGKLNQPYSETTKDKYIAAFNDPKSLYGNDCIMLNHHGEGGTVECRFFNSTSKPERLHAYLQFIRSLCYFCKSKRTLDLENYLAYCVDYKLRYPDLINYLAELGHISKPKSRAKQS